MKALTPGGVLLTNTTLLQASMFVERPNGEWGNAIAGLFDFVQLAAAFVLRPSLYTLDGDMLLPADTPRPWLLELLRREGVLHEGLLSFDVGNVRAALTRLMRSSDPDDSERSREVALIVGRLFGEDNSTGLEARLVGSRRAFYDVLVRVPGLAESLGGESGGFAFLNSAKALSLVRGTGGEDCAAYLLRTFLYSQAAVKEGVDFVPDFPRAALLASALDVVRRSTYAQVYAVLGESLRNEAKQLLLDQASLAVALPPVAALAMARASSPRDLGPALLELRHEFRDVRAAIGDLEVARAEAATVKDRNDAMARLRSITRAVSKKFGKTGTDVFEQLIDFLDDVAGPVLDPTNPSAYRAGIVKKPVEWLRGWWLRRPFAQVFNLAREFRSINEYADLVERVFGIRIDARDVALFEKSYVAVHNSWIGKGREDVAPSAYRSEGKASAAP